MNKLTQKSISDIWYNDLYCDFRKINTADIHQENNLLYTRNISCDYRENVKANQRNTCLEKVFALK